MKSSSVLLTIALILAGSAGCITPLKDFLGQIVYEEESDSTVYELPEGTIVRLFCLNGEGTGIRNYFTVEDGGYFDIPSFIWVWGDCRFKNIQLPGEYGETDYYECDSVESENCVFHCIFGPGTYELGVIQYKFLCHGVEDCEQWCDAHEDITCPSPECDECILGCSEDQC